MKIRTWKVGIAALALGASPVLAETSGWSYDNNVNGVAFASDCCEPACGADQCCDGVACGDGCGAGGLFSGCALAGPVEGFSLAGLIGAENSGWDFGGWTAVSYNDNNIPLSAARNDLRSFDDIPDAANVSQQWFYVGRVADGSGGLDFGARMDVVYGTDAQKTQSFGNPRSNGAAGERDSGTFDASWDHGTYGWAMPQLYMEVAYNDLSVKVGHFFTPLGYEVIPATGNFFHSHSYTMFNSEPFTHTGALGTYTGMGDGLTLYGGWALGWDTGFDQLNSGNIAISGFAYELADDVTFTYLNTYGNFGLLDGGSKNSYSHSMVLTAGLTDNLQYIAQSDLVRTDNPGVSQYDTIGLNQYLIYKLNDVISTGGRVEWWKADGTSYNQVTGGFNIHGASNLVIRPEARYDWAPGTPTAIFPSGNIEGETFAVDAILTY